MMTTLLLPLFVVLSLAQGSASVTVAPRYACEGQDPGGSTYTATLETMARGPLWLLRWSMGNGALVYGIGLLEGDRLTVAFRDDPGTITGLTIYQVATGTLRGRWTAFGASATFSEECLVAEERQARQ